MTDTSIDTSRQPGSSEHISDNARARQACLDRQAFTPIYERYASRVYRYARARAGSDDIAEDILSATMLDAMERIESFAPERGTLATWLFTSAAHRRSTSSPGEIARTRPTSLEARCG